MIIADRIIEGSPQGNLPAAPHLIICPVNLLDQWLSELHRFLEYGSFSILPYTGTCTEANRRAFWESWDALPSPVERRIIVATMTVSDIPALRHQ